MTISPTHLFGQRLRQARTLRGLSLRALAEALDGQVSHSALQKYETGKMMPDSGTLLALVDRLHLRPDYFFQPKPIRLSAIEFRKQTKFGKKMKDRVLEEAREYLERYLEIETILGLETSALPVVDLQATDPNHLEDAAESAAEEIRDRWQLGRNPLPNVVEMLEEHGVKVAEVTAEDGFDGFSGWAGEVPVIVLSNRWNGDLPRKRLTALHELGHLALKLPDDLPFKTMEGICYRFAGALLIPRDAFVDAFGTRRRGLVSPGELAAIKARWGMSIAAIMKRAERLGLISATAYKRFNIRLRKAGMHKAEPGRWSGDETTRRFRRLVHRAAARELITRSKAAGLLGISLRDFDAEFVETATSA